MSRARAYIAIWLLAVLLAVALCLQWRWIHPLAGALEVAEDRLFDLRVREALPPATDDGQVELVAIDDAAVTRYGPMPWPRTVHARLVDALMAAGARAIGFDVSFSSNRSSDRAGDEALVAAVKRSGKVVLVRDYSYGKDEQVVPDSLVDGLTEAARGADGTSGVSFPGLRESEDGRIRYLYLVPAFEYAAYGDRFGFPLVLAGRAQGGMWGATWDLAEVGDRQVSLTGGGLLVRAHPVPSVSVATVLDGGVRLDGKIALVAATNDVHDFKTVPGNRDGVPGGELLADGVETLLDGTGIVRWGRAFDLLVALLLVTGSTLAVYRWALEKGVLVSASLLLAWFGISLGLLHARRVWVDFTVPAFVVVFSLALQAIFDRYRMGRLLYQFVPVAVAERLLHSPHAEERGSGRLADATVVFVDIRGYTTLSEKMSPEQVMTMLNQFHQTLGAVFARHHGTVVNFEGDAQMVVFGAPIVRKDHAEQAVAAASQLKQELDRLNERLVTQHPELSGEGLRIGVGICTGQVSEGILGMEGRKQYTAIGDTTNMAARLQTLCRDLGVMVLMSHSTWERVGSKVKTRTLEPVSIKGKAELQQIYELLS